SRQPKLEGPAWRTAQHPMLGNGMRLPDGGWIFERALTADTVPFIADHVVNGSVIVPATAYIELLVAAGRNGPGWESVGIADLTIREAMVLDASSPRSVQLRIEPVDGDRCRRSEEHTSELQSREKLVCRLLLE